MFIQHSYCLSMKTGVELVQEVIVQEVALVVKVPVLILEPGRLALVRPILVDALDDRFQ